MTHLVPLGDTGWSVWRDVLLRGAGFPVDGLARFAAPDCAAAADRHLAGEVTAEVFAEAHAAAVAVAAAQVCGIAADPLFREAVAWQNPGVLVALDGLVAAGPAGPRNVRRRERENVVAGYWQRYAAKSETIGFFGPVCWGTVEPGAAGVTVRPGPALVRERRLYLEYWALAAYADEVAGDPRVRRWLAPVLPPHLTVEEREVLRPAQPPAAVTATEAALLRRCDGTRTAVDLVDALVADESSGVRGQADGFLLLANLADRGLLRWDADLPQGFDAERVLRARLAAIGEPEARDRALAGLDRLSAARARVAAAAGDATALTAALAALDAEFTGLTGRAPRRRAGLPYAGRTLCHEETVRDLDFTVGGGLLDALAPALALPLQAARWLTCALAAAYREALRELYAELVADGPVRLADLWFLAQGPLFGSGDRPLDAVARDFTARWDRVFGLAEVPGDTARLTFTAESLAPRVAAEFPATHPGWSAGRIHSPDLQLCADSADALGRGEFLAVLGELHAAWPTFDGALFTEGHPDVAALRRALAADLGPHRLRPLYPPDYPRTGGRLVPSLAGPTDRELAFADAPGADRARLLPATAATVSEQDGQLVVTAPDGHRLPVLEAFSALVAMHAAEAFKVMTDRPHTPRITVDRLVLARETWRTTVAGTGLVEGTDPAGRYLAVRRRRAALGLPERVFVRVATELKPSYVDLTSPLYASRLCLALRAADRAAGGGAPVTVTELLPDAEQSWLPDARGRRYVSELRLQVRDPAEPEGGPR
jgi:hypothetical protein